MNTESYNGALERKVLVALIVCRPVLARVAQAWVEPGLFASEASNTVGRLCVKYFCKHAQAPGKNFEALVRYHQARHPQRRDANALLESLAVALSGEYEQQSEDVNPDFAAGQAQRLFDLARATRVAEELQGHVLLGDADKAAALLPPQGRPELSPTLGVTLEEEEVWRQAWEQREKPVLTFSGGLGEFFGNQLRRGTFYSFLAPEKRGKSLWMLWMAFQAVAQRKRVAYFECGDMTQAEVLTRAGAFAARRPLEAKTVEVPTGVELVRELKDPHCGEARRTGFREKQFASGLSWADARAAYLRFKAEQAKSRRVLFRLFNFPTYTLTVDTIRSTLDAVARTGRDGDRDWEADVVIVDHADLLAPPRHVREGRDQINAVWMALRGMSMERNHLLITASQTTRESYKSKVIAMWHQGEDKRKSGHVSGAIGINQTDWEKAQGTFRLNWVVLRDAHYLNSRVVACAGVRDFLDPAVKSAFPKVLEAEDGEDE